jgi:hypothetical protein
LLLAASQVPSPGATAPHLPSPLTDGTSIPGPYTYTIETVGDDGTEHQDSWFEYGYDGKRDFLGADASGGFCTGLRFHMPDLEQGQAVAYARLRLAAQGGSISSPTAITIRAIAEDSPEPLSNLRLPSQLPKTVAEATWPIDEQWESGYQGPPLYYSSPDLATIINEILSRPGWGQGPAGKVIIITVDSDGSPPGESNYVRVEDCYSQAQGIDPAVLEIYPTLADAFIGYPMLGRPTDTGITVNAIHLMDIDAYVEYGVSPGAYTSYTAPLLDNPGGEPVEIVIDGLDPNLTYYYRMRYREAGGGEYLALEEGSFHTQRSRGSTFVFAVQADPQLLDSYDDSTRHRRCRDLYSATVANAAGDCPDFCIEMGDFASVDLIDRNASNEADALDRYLMQRRLLGAVTDAIPFFLVLGNHEGEQGWRAMNDEDDLEIWGTRARKQALLNPYPDGFYSGSADTTEGCGIRQNYYAWEWGDVLLVVLDPFWHTTTKPHWYFLDDYTASNDAWDWTLGKDQYDWLYDTLHNSDALWKLVFCHHMTGGVYSGHPVGTPYGRGGIEAAKHSVAGLPSFEWGGEKANGAYVFESKRPGWDHGPIHDMMVAEGVDIFFHGHDHVFVYQVLDGIIYQACPQCSDDLYSDGFYGEAGYQSGVKWGNSGHLRVTASPDEIQVAYVRSVLPEDEPILEGGTPISNGDVCFSYSTSMAGTEHPVGHPPEPRLWGVKPNPFTTAAKIDFQLSAQTETLLEVYDTAGRKVRRLIARRLDAGRHSAIWDGCSDAGEGVAPGVYLCRLRAGARSAVVKLVFLR